MKSLGLKKGSVPTRTWKPGKVWVARDGIFPKSPKCLDTYAPFESSLEALAHLHLSVDPRIAEYVCQPEPIIYWMPGRRGGRDKHSYTPDFVARTRDERLLVIDAKASFFAQQPAWTDREPHIRETYWREYGAELIVWNEHELKAEPRLTNARTLYRHRFAPSDKSLCFEIRRQVSIDGNSWRLGDLCSTVSRLARVEVAACFSTVMRMALTGEVSLCPRRPYGCETLVTIGES